MSGRSSLVASAEQQAALRELAASAVRGEADRARAVLVASSKPTFDPGLKRGPEPNASPKVAEFRGRSGVGWLPE